MKYILSLSLFFLMSWISGQNIDSLRFRIQSTSNLQEKISLMNDLMLAYQRVSPDSALDIGFRALMLIPQDSLKQQWIRIQTNLGIVYLNRGEYPKADSLFGIALEMAVKIKDLSQIALLYNNLGLSQSSQHKYNEAIDFYLKSAHLSDSLNIMETSVRTLVNIGVIYHYQNNARRALDYHLMAIDRINRHNLEMGTMYSVLLRNTGAFYQLLGLMDSAYHYTYKSLEISRKNNDKRGLSICYQNLGDFICDEEPEKAEILYQKSLALKKELKNFNGIAHTAASLGDLNKKMGRYHKAEQYFNQAIEYAEMVGDINLLNETHLLLSQVYENQGDIAKSLKHHKLYVENKDTLVKRSNEAKLLELQTQYETSLKEKQILELKHRQNVNEITIKNSRRVIVISLVAIVVIIILLFLVYRAFLSIKRKRDILSEKNAIIEQQYEEITTQRDHLADSNLKIQVQHKQIEDSINYASQIQESLLPSDIIMRSALGEYALFYLPKDVVSGDFYWVNQVERFTFVAVGDCTGHGVPGAFMSVLSISLLNEIVKGKGIINPSGILNELRRLVIASLKQDGNKMGGTDGLELAICRIDKNTKQLVFAGAQRSLLLLRDGEIEEFLPNKMPVSAHVAMLDFTENEIDVRTGDILYLFTDGFQDQFEVQNSHRYGKQRFKELLRSRNNLTLDEQQKALETEFSTWKGVNEQIDDVLVLGFRIESTPKSNF